MQFKYGDVIKIKSGFFAGLTGKCVDAQEHLDDSNKKVWHYAISVSAVRATPYEQEDNLEATSYAIDYNKEQKLVDNA